MAPELAPDIGNYDYHEGFVATIEIEEVSRNRAKVAVTAASGELGRFGPARLRKCAPLLSLRLSPRKNQKALQVRKDGYGGYGGYGTVTVTIRLSWAYGVTVRYGNPTIGFRP